MQRFDKGQAGLPQEVVGQVNALAPEFHEVLGEGAGSRAEALRHFFHGFGYNHQLAPALRRADV